MQKTGYYNKVIIGEPKDAIPEDVAAALWMRSAAVTGIYANGGTAELHVVTVRVFYKIFTTPEEKIENALALMVSQTLSDIAADADLGGTVREVDFGGMHGSPLRVDWGHVEVSGTKYRIVDILLPLSIDDSATIVL